MSEVAPLHPLAALFVVVATMAAEAAWSAANERRLLALGARLVPDPSYPWMRLAYPLGFLMVCLDGWWRGVPSTRGVAAGIVVFALGKAIKYAAIATLGPRWSFRVLVLPQAPLVSHGIYRVLRHPNYIGVAGEVLGIALWMHAPITGTLFAVTFGVILLWRIRIEERALGLTPRA
jgi:methyltransferase